MAPAPTRQTRTWWLRALPLVVAAAVVSAAGPARAATEIAPVLECVALHTDGSFTAVFGTDNQTGGNVVIPVGKHTNGKWSNQFQGTANLGQPTLILAGRQRAAFTVTSPDGGRLQWDLGDAKASADAGDTPCLDQPSVPDVPTAALAGLAALLGAAGALRRMRASGAAPTA